MLPLYFALGPNMALCQPTSVANLGITLHKLSANYFRNSYAPTLVAWVGPGKLIHCCSRHHHSSQVPDQHMLEEDSSSACWESHDSLTDSNLLKFRSLDYLKNWPLCARPFSLLFSPPLLSPSFLKPSPFWDLETLFLRGNATFLGFRGVAAQEKNKEFP